MVHDTCIHWNESMLVLCLFLILQCFVDEKSLSLFIRLIHFPFCLVDSLILYILQNFRGQHLHINADCFPLWTLLSKNLFFFLLYFFWSLLYYSFLSVAIEELSKLLFPLYQQLCLIMSVFSLELYKNAHRNTKETNKTNITAGEVKRKEDWNCQYKILWIDDTEDVSKMPVMQKNVGDIWKKGIVSKA